MFARKMRHNLAKFLSWIRVSYYRIMGVKIGKDCFISSRARIDVRRGKIIIGNNVHIGGGSYILSHAGFQPVKEGKETVIEDNVRIFVNSVILPGIRVGKNSIIGAGSVVTKDVPPNVVVMGNPARVIQHLDQKK
jgi:acetyltransferase-like isoleucine patch superfamily enzyme